MFNGDDGYTCNCNQTACRHVALHTAMVVITSEILSVDCELFAVPLVVHRFETWGGRYVPPTTRTAPCKAPCGAHRPREDVRPARGGRAWWTETGDGIGKGMR